MKNKVNILIPIYYTNLDNAIYPIKMFLMFDLDKSVNDIHFYFNGVPKSKINELLKEIINLTKFNSLGNNNFSYVIKTEAIPPAKICAEYFKSNADSYVLLLNDDIIIKYNYITKIINYLIKLNPIEYPYIWFPKVDYINIRNHENYFYKPFRFDNALRLSEIYGEDILGFLWMYKKYLNDDSLYKTNIGFGFFAVYTNKIPNEAYDLLNSFEVGERGYDKLFAEFINPKYLMVDVFFIHLPRTNKLLDGVLWKKFNNKLNNKGVK